VNSFCSEAAGAREEHRILTAFYKFLFASFGKQKLEGKQEGLLSRKTKLCT